MQGYLNRLLNDWIGNEGFLHKFRMEMRRSNYQGDIMTFKGKVTNKHVKNGEHYRDADIWCENEREGVTTPGKCTVTLLTKG